MLERLRSLGPLFLALVVAPTLIAILYFGILTANVYVSESRFLVRSAGKQSTTPLGTILAAGGFASANSENYAVVDYVQSRKALADGNRDGLVNRIYGTGKGNIVDRFGTFGGRTQEHLYRYYLDKVTIDFDTSTQVTRLSVRAFAPGDARVLNERLLEQAEALVNRLSERGRRDAIALAESEVEAARDRARAAAVALARFSNQSGVVDPEKQAEVNLQMIAKLQDALIGEQTQLAQLLAYTPANPQIPAVRTRIATLKGEIDRQTAGVAGAPRSLAGKTPQFQQLRFDAEFSGKQLGLALASLEDARKDAAAKQIYVERIADPNLPDYPTEPHRLRNVLATLVLGLLAWGVVVTLIAGVREHRD